MAVGGDPAPRHQIRVHQRCQMDIMDEYWYFDRPQRTITHLRATLSRFDKCSFPSLLQRSDWIGCNLPLFMTSESTCMVIEGPRWPQAMQGVILALWSRRISICGILGSFLLQFFSLKIRPRFKEMTKYYVKLCTKWELMKMERRKVRVG